MSLLTKRLPVGTNVGYSTLSGSITDSATNIVVSSGSPFPELSAGVNRRRWIPAVIVDAPSPSEVTFGDLQSGEHIAITGHVSGSTTLTIIRGAAPVAWGSGSLIMITPTAAGWESAFQRTRTLEAALVASLGGGVGAGVANYGPTAGGSLKATQSAPTPNMTISIAPGICFYDLDLQWLEAAQTFAFVAPVTSTRVDRICAFPEEDTVVKVAGTEGAGTPALPTGYVPLWLVTIRVGATSIKEADDATNGYLTDARGI